MRHNDEHRGQQKYPSLDDANDLYNKGQTGSANGCTHRMLDGLLRCRSELGVRRIDFVSMQRSPGKWPRLTQP
ncbi:hypothetical protein M413DRAFT_441955 [Hebeloma cylindrosporum]|uniref:Uncharacterized protein n=1 Tax=Hebeloma cylindrosporum TaxID=76867 RepID=A0A0C2Y601_HEBCY|nr:hypothetical protein M413DRAFT_441955 [Hebeloma cylindrosporum h7]